jgi:multidrug efflux system membrane fusion protein
MKKAWPAVFLIISILFMVAGCSRSESLQSPVALRVTAGKAIAKSMPVEVKTVGTVEPYLSVRVMAQIDGQLQSIHFVEGKDVKKGDPLVTIDPASFKERLRQEEAKLAKDMAQLKYRSLEAGRYRRLLEKGAVSRSEFEQNEASAGELEGAVQADRAAVEQARIDLDYCYVLSPIDGRTGSYLLHRGNIVEKNKTQLVTVNQVVPIYVKFSVPEKVLPDVRKYAAGRTISVSAAPAGYGRGSREGKLTFIDNTVNTDTGMIMLKATFPNSDKFFWPGQFVDVTVALSVDRDVIVIPSRAVQMSQKGEYAFVVKPDMTVEFRALKVARALGDETVVASGIAAGETVVTDGQLMLRDGFPVEIVDGRAPPPAEKAK